MKKQSNILTVTAALTLSTLLSANAAVLISHTFAVADNNPLNGTSLSENNIGASTWFSGTSGSYVEKDGTINVANGSSAWVDLNGAIGTGTADDQYELAIVVDNFGVGQQVMGGFWGPTSPTTTGNHDFQFGTAWWLWAAGGNLTAFGGPDQVDPTASTSLSTAGGAQLLTLALDLRDASLANNTLSLYIGDSTSGTLVGTANFSGDESFDEVGISGRFINNEGAIVTSLTLSQVPEPSTLALLGLGTLLSLWIRRRARR